MFLKITALFLSLSLSGAFHGSTAQAKPNQAALNQNGITKLNSWGYIPLVEQTERPLRTSNSGGRRGCDLNNPIDINLLAPNDHIATTVSGHPTFLWNVSKTTSVPMRFALVESSVAEPVLELQLKVEKPGIYEIKVPPNIPELKVGRIYRWTVSLTCNETSPSQDSYAYVIFERVPITSKLAQELAVATNERERSLVYAQSGIWYDAISTMWKACIAAPTKRVNFQAFNRLLNQVNIDL